MTLVATVPRGGEIELTHLEGAMADATRPLVNQRACSEAVKQRETDEEEKKRNS